MARHEKSRVIETLGMSEDYVFVQIQYTWIKDKLMTFYGDDEYGSLVIMDKDENILKIIGYERVK